MISNNDHHPKNVRQGISHIGDSKTNTKYNMPSIIPSDISESYVEVFYGSLPSHNKHRVSDKMSCTGKKVRFKDLSKPMTNIDWAKHSS